MKNVHDIVFADGTVIPRGCLEYLGSVYGRNGYAIHEFREYRFPGDCSVGSGLISQMKKDDQQSVGTISEK